MYEALYTHIFSVCQLRPPRKFNLEEAMAYIQDDEMLEGTHFTCFTSTKVLILTQRALVLVTPTSLRMRLLVTDADGC